MDEPVSQQRSVDANPSYDAQPARDVVVLGASGSIGRQALDVISQHANRLRLRALSVNRSVAFAVQAARTFGVECVAIGDESLKGAPELEDLPVGCTVLWGASGIEDLIGAVDCDTVLNALVGYAGLRASYRTLISGKRLALANKESLVVGGDLLMPLAGPGSLIPVDSEHGAVFQCLKGEDRKDVSRIWITASGGPFRGCTRTELAEVTAPRALAHPTWHMGPKITIDSATLMNKGLEVIEAHHLFGASFDDIRVVVHPQSTIHSMVEYRDGSVKAHLGVTDMRIPIQYAFSWPQRWDAPTDFLDFTTLGDLTFKKPDLDTFICLRLALEAGCAGGTAPAALNAANEVAVARFLAGACGFNDIGYAVDCVLSKLDVVPVSSLEQLEEVDRCARAQARRFLDDTADKEKKRG